MDQCVSDTTSDVRSADAAKSQVNALACIDENVRDFLWYDRMAIQFQYPKSMTINREVESCEPRTANQLHSCNLGDDMVREILHGMMNWSTI